MNPNPFYNALLAVGYIIAIILTIFYSPHLMGGEKESILFPIVGLATFVLSAAVMAYLFFYQPVLLFLDGERQKGVNFFLRTVGYFAGTVLVIFVISIVVNR